MPLVRDDLREWLEERAGLSLGELRDDAPLFSTGLLDSLTILDLCRYIETKSGLAMRWLDVGQANIDSVNAILDYVEKRKSSPR